MLDALRDAWQQRRFSRRDVATYLSKGYGGWVRCGCATCRQSCRTAGRSLGWPQPNHP